MREHETNAATDESAKSEPILFEDMDIKDRSAKTVTHLSEHL